VPNFGSRGVEIIGRLRSLPQLHKKRDASKLSSWFAIDSGSLRSGNWKVPGVVCHLFLRSRSEDRMPDTKGQIVFQQIGIGGILKQYRLVVPPNQREFSWTDKEVTTLFQDFAKAISDGEPEYFLGTITTLPRSPDLLEVIDGQQRLATVAILLSQIRNYLQDQDREPLIAESINNGFLTDIDREKRERVAKLRLNLDDNEFFRMMIGARKGDKRPEQTRKSHELISDAFEKAEQQVKHIVSGFDPKDHGDVLNKWILFAEHGTQVILLRVPTGVNAYKMFLRLRQYGLEIPGLERADYRVGRVRSRLQKERFL